MSYQFVDSSSYVRASHESNLVFMSTVKMMSEAPTFLFLLTMSAVFFAIRYFVKYHIMSPLAKACNVVNKKQVEGFVTNAWYACYYTTFLSFGCLVLFLEDWDLWPLHNVWKGWPLHPLKPLLKMYYLLELTFYFHCMVALSFEKRHKDFYQTLVHHLASFFLVGMSYWMRFFRIGLLILIVHNISDVFLFISKTLHYYSNINPKFKAITNGTFTFFGVSFFVSRLVCFPMLIYSWVYDASYIIGPSAPIRRLFNTSVITLQVLHVYWFYLIVQMALRLSAAGDKNVPDVRSDSEGEEDEDEDEQKEVKKEK